GKPFFTFPLRDNSLICNIRDPVIVFFNSSGKQERTRMPLNTHRNHMSGETRRTPRPRASVRIGGFNPRSVGEVDRRISANRPAGTCLQKPIVIRRGYYSRLRCDRRVSYIPKVRVTAPQTRYTPAVGKVKIVCVRSH